MAAAPAWTSAAPVPDREEIVFLDVETSTPPCVLLEFGAVVVCSRRLVDVSSFATLVRPANLDALPDPTARSNGITRGTLADAPPFRDVADMVYDVLHGRVWAGHNIVHFDSMIIRDAFADIGRPPPQPKAMIDTLPLLTQCFGPRAGDMKLASLANYFGLGKQRHRSLDDVKMNIDVFKNCATVLFLEESLRGQNMSSGGATIRTQGITSDPAPNRDNPNESLLVGLGSSHVEEMMLDTTVTVQTDDTRSSGAFSGFVELDDVSTESIKISAPLFLRPFGPRAIVQHKGSPLQLICPGLEVLWVNTKGFPNSPHRPKVGIKVDIPENLSKVLGFCDDLAQSSSSSPGPGAICSNSRWKSLIERDADRRPTVWLKIPTFGSGDTAACRTHVYEKECDGVVPRLVSERVDPSELASMLQGNKVVDAFVSVETFDHYQSAGIRLVANRLDVHFKRQQQA